MAVGVGLARFGIAGRVWTRGVARAATSRAYSSSSTPAPGKQYRSYHSYALGGLGGLMGAAFASCLVTPAEVLAESVHDDGSKGNLPLTRNFIADAVEVAAPSVVNICFQKGNRVFMSESQGSGVIINEQGDIVTNAHVVGQAVDTQVTVTLTSGETIPGTVIALDSGTDLAVVRMEPATPRKFHAAKMGHSKGLRAGEWVVALGSPLRLKNSVTAGIVSSASRDLRDLVPGGQRGGPDMLISYIQHDAAVNSGNSGGPLVNLDGEVVGINCMVAAAAQGISFAIPIDAARGVLRQLSATGRASKPYLGFSIATLTPALLDHPQLKSEYPNFPVGVTTGAFVGQVAPAGPALRAGIRPGDVVVEFEGKPVTQASQVPERMGMDVGRTFTVVIARGRDRHTVQVTAGTKDGR